MKYYLTLALSFFFSFSFAQCIIGPSSLDDAIYISSNGYQASINYCPIVLDGIGSCQTWATEVAHPDVNIIRKKYQYKVLQLFEETTIQFNVGLSIQNLSNQFLAFNNQTIESLAPYMNDSFTSFTETPSNLPFQRVTPYFFIMDGCPSTWGSEILISSRKFNIPVNSLYMENQYGVSRCIAGVIGDIDLTHWNKAISINITLQPGEYWFYVGFEIINNTSNWGWINWSISQNSNTCEPAVVLPQMLLAKPIKYEKVVLMNNEYKGMLLYDRQNNKYYDFTLREVIVK